MFLLWADSADCPNIWVLLYIDVCFPCRLQQKTRFLKSFSLRPKYLGVHYFVILKALLNARVIRIAISLWHLALSACNLLSSASTCKFDFALAIYPLLYFHSWLLFYSRSYLFACNSPYLRLLTLLIATQCLIQVCPHMSSDSAEHYCFWIISCVHIFAIRIFPI